MTFESNHLNYPYAFGFITGTAAELHRTFALKCRAEGIELPEEAEQILEDLIDDMLKEAYSKGKSALVD